MARLLLSGPDGKGESVEVAGTVIIGRGANCDLRLRKDPKVSRQHCKIEPRRSEVVLSDLGSANGTRLNGEPIGNKIVRLENGDVVGVGGTDIRFQAETELGAGAEGKGGLLGRLAQRAGKLIRRGQAGEGGQPVVGDKTVTCVCGAVLSTANKSPGQKIGCPRCKRVYKLPGK